MIQALVVGMLLAVVGVWGLAKALYLVLELQSNSELSPELRKKMSLRALGYFVFQLFVLGAGLFLAIYMDLNPLWLGLGLPLGALLMVFIISKMMSKKNT